MACDKRTPEVRPPALGPRDLFAAAFLAGAAFRSYVPEPAALADRAYRYADAFAARRGQPSQEQAPPA